MSAALVVAGGLKGRAASAADQATVDQLVRELEAMKQRMEKVEKLTQEQQETIRRQSETIRQLTAGRKVTPAGAAAVVTRKPPASGAEKPTVAAGEPDLSAHDEALKREVTENIMRRIQPSLAGANKTFLSQFNPAIGFIIDTVGS